MKLNIKDKKAFISGSTSGIGLAVAIQLASEGAHVILNGRTQESINKAKEKVLEFSPDANISGIAADFKDRLE